MSSPLALSTASSLNRRPVKNKPSPLNPKDLPVVDCTQSEHGASHIKREQQHHGEDRIQRVPHQAEREKAVQRPIKQERRSRARNDGDGRITNYLDRIEERFPGNPKIYDDFLKLMDSHRSAEDALLHVSLLLRRAPELVQDYTKLTNVLNAQWFRDRHPRPTQLPLPPLSTPSQHHRLPRQPKLDLYADDSLDDDNSASENDSTSDDGSDVDEDEKAHASSQNAGMLIDLRKVHTAQENADMQKLLLLPDIDIPPEERKKTPRAMSCTLMEHQKVCLTWLIQQEQDSHKKGGLLADTMGLGKTVQALALILARPSRDPACKTTLVVAPVALLKQWEREIQTKVKAPHKLKTYILHGPVQRGMTVSKLLSYDVVLTTYGKVASEYKPSSKQKTKKRPLLLANDARFHRIILDEAHNIKNRRSGRSIAVCQLKATYRLCMTGTPFMNDVTEIFSLVRFLHISPYNSWEWFNEDIARPIKRWDEDERSEAMAKLQVLFRSITLRRTKTSMLDGKQIIQLPTLTVEKSDVEFDEDQQAFYDALEKQQRLEFNKYLRYGLDGGSYAYILVLLLRLRQACCHPHLIKDQCIPDGTELNSEDMIDLALKLKETVVARIKSQRGFHCPICNMQPENPIINYPCGHHLCGGCFTSMMELNQLGASLEDAPESACPQPSCSAKIDPDKVLCYYYFREAHMDDDSEDEAVGDDDDPDMSLGAHKLEDDADAQGNLKGFVVSDDHDEDDKEFVREDEDIKNSDMIYTSHPTISEETGESSKPTDNYETKNSQDDGPTESEVDEDSDNDSLPSLEQIRQQVFGEILLAKGRPEQTNEDSTLPDSGSESETQQVAASKGKRKRSPSYEADKSTKKAKTKGASTKQRNSRKGRGKERAFKSLAALKKDASNNVAAKAEYLKRLRKDFVSSAKIDKTLEVLQSIRDQSPGEKTLVFSLWTSFLDLLEIPIHDQGFRYTRYDGSMHPKVRDEAVRAFMEKPEVEVMLVSLMAGNAGLNLTAATNIIILEPFWNPFVEDQAIDRAHRIGQKRPVTVHRVLIAGTVEDRIQDLQEKKRKLVSAALSEEGAETSSRLSRRELMGLFGVR